MGKYSWGVAIGIEQAPCGKSDHFAGNEFRTFSGVVADRVPPAELCHARASLAAVRKLRRGSRPVAPFCSAGSPTTSGEPPRKSRTEC